MNILVWLIILVLIVVNALYVAAEFSAVGARRSQIQQLAQSGNGLARRLFPVVNDSHRLDRYIATCQIGITLSSLILGAYGQATLAVGFASLLQRAGGLTEVAAASTAAIATLIFLTILQVVFGELVPKSLALQFPTSVALNTFWPMRASEIFFAPLIWILNGSGLWVLKRLGMGGEGSHRHIHSPEEIGMLIADSREGGLLDPQEQHRLHGALQLARRTARELMVPRERVSGLELSTPWEAALQVAESSPYTRLPVYRGSLDDVAGLLHTKDLAVRFALGSDAEGGVIRSVEEVLRPISRVAGDVTADRLLEILREQRSRLALVTDERGMVQGIVTLEDVIAELLGDVADEFKDS